MAILGPQKWWFSADPEFVYPPPRLSGFSSGFDPIFDPFWDPQKIHFISENLGFWIPKGLKKWPKPDGPGQLKWYKPVTRTNSDLLDLGGPQKGAKNGPQNGPRKGPQNQLKNRPIYWP
jgi:hypothetical protein